MKILRSTLIALLLLLHAPALPAQTGATGLSFLKMGIAGRELAMGDAGAGSVRGAAAVYYNPAGLADSAAVSQFLFTHRSWIEGTTFDHIAGSIVLGNADGVGFAVTSVAVPDLEIRLRPGESEGTFTARNFAAGLSWGHRLTEDFAAGVTVRYLYEKILIDEAGGLAADLGFRYLTGIENLTVGAAVANIGSMSSLRAEGTPLPTLLRAGGTYLIPSDGGEIGGEVVADVVKVFGETDLLFNVGGEAWWREMVAVRAGYQFGSSGRGFTAGLGIRYGVFLLDYAYARLAEGLGDGHAFTVGVAL